MNRNFEKRLEAAKNPRARRRNAKRKQKFLRPKSHVGAVMRDMFGSVGYEDAPCGNRLFNVNPHQMARDVIGATVGGPLLAVHHLAVAAAMDGVDAVKKRMGKRERMETLAKRRAYYAAEAAVRAERREQIRAARPEPANAFPTPDALVEAYQRRRESEEWQLRFGTLMIDLEEHVRRTYEISVNRFTGSSGGVKDWLKKKCPLLAKHYSTCQRYKRLAQDYSGT